MEAAGKIASLALLAMKSEASIGVTTLHLDEVARETLKRHHATPALLNYHPRFSDVPYLYATCISVNDEVIHGQPSARTLKDGDLVGLDLVAELDGWLGDTAITILISKGNVSSQRLLSVTREAMFHGIKQAIPGNHMGDISHAVQRLVERNGFGVIRELSGHGIGHAVHEEGVEVPNFGRPGKGLLLRPGMTFCVEPMVTMGSPAIRHRPGDPWAVVTRDGKPGAHFEHTIGVTDDGPRILTQADPAANGSVTRGQRSIADPLVTDMP